MRFATLVVAAWLAAVGLASQVGAHPGHSACQEDEACWNCAEMGNGVCGPEGMKEAQR